MGILHVLEEEFVGVAGFVEGSDVGVEFEVVGVQLVHVTAYLALVQ